LIYFNILSHGILIKVDLSKKCIWNNSTMDYKEAKYGPLFMSPHISKIQMVSSTKWRKSINLHK
jgi:hypothetical protein